MNTRTISKQGSLKNRVNPADYPVVVSFYAGDPYYYRAAKQLKADCERLGLDYDIREAPLKKPISWIEACRYKIKFIYRVLEEHKRPILWVDVDSRLLARPEVLKKAKTDMAFFLRAFRYLKNYDPLTVSRTIDPSLVYYAYTEQARQFVRLMKSLEAKHRGNATDDYFLQEAWVQFPRQPSVLLLPPDMRSLELLPQGRGFFYFGRSGQVSVHKDNAEQHPIALYSPARLKPILANEASILIAASNPDGALTLLKRAFEIDPSDAGIANRLARLLRQQGKYRNAIEVLSSLKADEHIDYQGRFKAESEMLAGNLRRSRAETRKLIADGNPEDVAWAKEHLQKLAAWPRASALARFKNSVKDLDARLLNGLLLRFYARFVNKNSAANYER